MEHIDWSEKMNDLQEHLKKTEKDQLLIGFDALDNTVRNEPGRHAAVSQLFQPILTQGYWSASQGRYVPGFSSWRDNMTPNYSWSTTSQASLTLTCAAGHRYRVYYAGARNATQATALTLSGVIGGDAWTEFQPSESAETPFTATRVCIGANGTQADPVGGACSKPALTEIWLNAADTLTMTLGTFAAGNNTEHLFLFEDFTL